MIKTLGIALVASLSLAACKGGDQAAGSPCERLAVALCADVPKDLGLCQEFVKRSNEGKDPAKADGWCASIVDDPAAVKVHMDDAKLGASGVRR